MSEETRDSVNVSVPVLTAEYLLFLGELLDLWMTVKRSFPEIPDSLDTALQCHIIPLLILLCCGNEDYD